MAERRMFTQKITESDAFLEMPCSTQNFYFHLCMHADDDGFVNSPKKIQRIIGATDDDAKILIAKNFIIPFESGVIVIKHWRMHNQLRKDRYHPTDYYEEKCQLYLKSDGAYTLDGNQGESLSEITWQPNGNQMATEYSIGKDSIGKDNKEKSVREKKDTPFNSEDFNRFIGKYNISIDGYSSKLHEMDFKALDRAYQTSEYLRTNILSLSFICKEYDRILGGYYKDWKKPSVAKTENDRKYTSEELNALIKDADKVEF